MFKNLLLLGGFYVVVCFILYIYIDLPLLGFFVLEIFFALCLWLIYKKRFLFLEKFKHNFPQASLYVMSMGWLFFVMLSLFSGLIIKTLIGALSGYNDTVKEDLSYSFMTIITWMPPLIIDGAYFSIFMTYCWLHFKNKRLQKKSV